MIVVSTIDALVTIVASFVCIQYWGLVGAAGATVLSAMAAALVSFVIGFSKFGLTLPWAHLARIGLATAAMAALLTQLPEAPSHAFLAAHIAAGAAMYLLVLAILYAPTLFRMFRRQPQLSEL
jgi:O-antigen/teichoic acid export membrane protein